MAKQRISRLQKRILSWLEADWQRMQGTTSSSHYDLVKHLIDVDKANLSRSLVNLEKKSFISIGRSEGGLAESIIYIRILQEVVTKDKSILVSMLQPLTNRHRGHLRRRKS